MEYVDDGKDSTTALNSDKIVSEHQKFASHVSSQSAPGLTGLSDQKQDGEIHTLSVGSYQQGIEPMTICVICLELVESPATALPCQHDYFHASCLGTWLQENQTCPLCKSGITQLRLKDHYSKTSSMLTLPKLATSDISSETTARSTQPRSQFAPRRRVHRSSSSHTVNPSLRFRRQVYERGLPSLYVGNNAISRYRNINPSVIASDTSLLPRARLWIRRELRALDPYGQFCGSPSSATYTNRENTLQNVEFLLEYIIAILKHIDLKGSAGQARFLVREHLGSCNARLFLHELESWLRSPFKSLEEWDEFVQYPAG